jgi:methionyl-tRNA formyltransferase
MAAERRIPVIEARYANDESICRRIAEVKPDIMVLSNWRTWVSPSVYSIPTYQGINIHDSLLPRYGGFAPINWAIINGETETGVTAHFLSEEFDLGDILLQRKVPICFSETATDIFIKTINIIPEITLESLDLIEFGRVVRIPQDRSKATFFHKRSAYDSLIDWNRSNVDIYNLVRAQSDPYLNAYTFFQGKRLMIKHASLPELSYCGTPGRVLCRSSQGVVVICGSSQGRNGQGLVVHYVQEDGGEPVSALEYFKKMGSYLGCGLTDTRS